VIVCPDFELLNRGHSVTGISRNPNSFGTHKRYTGVSLNILEAPTSEFAAALKGYDVVIWYALKRSN
jgi:putative NADH-flavin reductase